MTTHDDGVRRALALVRAKADALIAAVIDAEAAMAGDPLPLADAVLKVERLVTADSMEPGGWVRWPGSPRWFAVTQVSVRPGRPNHRFVHYRLADGTQISREVEAADTFPYLTPAEMDEVAA